MLIKSRHCGIAISSGLLFIEAAVVHTTVVSTKLIISLREISKRCTRALTISATCRLRGGLVMQKTGEQRLLKRYFSYLLQNRFI